MAAELIAKLTLDTYRENKIPPLVIPQRDYKARVVEVRLTTQGRPVLADATAAASITAKRLSDGREKTFAGEMNENGTCTVPITQWMLESEGTVHCTVSVTGSDYQYSANKFDLYVKYRPDATEVSPDDPQKDLITEVIAGEAGRVAAEEKRVSAEIEREIAESERNDNEEARNAAETERQAAEQTRKDAEAARVASETERAEEFATWGETIAGVEQYDSRISRNDKRITNLEQGLMADAYETDASVAYVKYVPANALPYAAVAKVGGMTYKDGDTLKSAKVTEIESVGVNLCKFANGTHVLKSGVSLTLDDGHFEVDVKVSAAVEVSSLLWMPYTTVRLQAGTYTLSITNYKGLFGGAYIKDMTNNAMMVSGGEKTCNFTIDKETDVAFGLYFNFATATTETIIGDMMLNKGATAQPYRPYVKHTLPIPEAVQALDGHGEGLPDYPNSVIWAKDGRILWNEAVEKDQFTGNEPWYLDLTNTHGAYVYALKISEKIAKEGVLLCDRFEYAQGAWGTKGVGYCSDSANGLVYFNTTFASLAEWKSYLAVQYAAGTPVTVVYALVTPKVTDISDILPADNLLGVEGGGTITAVNENALAVPTEIIYQLKGVAE